MGSTTLAYSKKSNYKLPAGFLFKAFLSSLAKKSQQNVTILQQMLFHPSSYDFWLLRV